MAKDRAMKLRLPIYDRATQGVVICDVSIDVDFVKLAKILGAKALANKGHFDADAVGVEVTAAAFRGSQTVH